MIEPQHVDVLAARGLASSTRPLREAVETLDALTLAPDHGLQFRTRGVALLKLDALRSPRRLRRVLAQRRTTRMRATMLPLRWWRAADGERLRRQAACHQSAPRRALLGKGAALQNLTRFAEAVAAYDEVLAIDPQRADAHYSAATALLSTGNFQRGLAEYEWRRSRVPGSASVVQPFREPIWLGESPLRDKTLLIHAEQGMGDVIYAVRYVPRLARRGARVVLQVHAALKLLWLEGTTCGRKAALQRSIANAQ